jgi:hypothetical protein
MVHFVCSVAWISGVQGKNNSREISQRRMYVRQIAHGEHYNIKHSASKTQESDGSCSKQHMAASRQRMRACRALHIVHFICSIYTQANEEQQDQSACTVYTHLEAA